MSLRKDLPSMSTILASPPRIMAAADMPDGPRQVLAAVETVGAQVREHRAALDARIGELQANLQHTQQSIAKMGLEGGSGRPFLAVREDIGKIVEDSPGFQALKSGNTNTCKIALPPNFFHAALTSDSTAAGGTVPVQRLDGIFVAQQRQLTIRDLMTSLPADTGSIEYVREKTATFTAAPVAEGTQKPQSTFELELMTAKIITIAHWAHASIQILSDMPQLQNYLDTRLRFGLRYKEEQQLLMGSGTGGNLSGMYTLAQAFSAPFDPPGTETMLDTLRLAIAQLENNSYAANGIVMHPLDWARIELLKDADGKYLLSAADRSAGSVWGVPVVKSLGMTIDKFLVGDFRAAGFILDRQDPTVDIALTDQDDFVKNLCKIRAEERVGLVIQQPYALVKGDLGNVTNGDE